MVWKAEKIIPMMLIFLNISLIWIVIYYIADILDSRNYWQCKNFSEFENWFTLISVMPAQFLMLAVILNINKWIYFIIRIRNFVRVEARVAELEFEVKSEA